MTTLPDWLLAAIDRLPENDRERVRSEWDAEHDAHERERADRDDRLLAREDAR